ncbi:MAG: CHAP domain-containing protein [Candidatus Gastranaerophilales bacterium]|nr:CHAP domain-containing protein [Candidatus Gastranaerophilales bacterium]
MSSSINSINLNSTGTFAKELEDLSAGLGNMDSIFASGQSVSVNSSALGSSKNFGAEIDNIMKDVSEMQTSAGSGFSFTFSSGDDFSQVIGDIISDINEIKSKYSSGSTINYATGLSDADTFGRMVQDAINDTNELKTYLKSGKRINTQIPASYAPGTTSVEIAQSLLGLKESDSSYLKVTQGRREAWCADTVSYIYEQANGSCPWGYRDGKSYYKACVSEIRSWGQNQGLYHRKESVTKVNAGDLIIFEDNGYSHIGIVESVDADGTVHTIEGNTSDSCARRSYTLNDSHLSGFVDMSKYNS